MKVAANNQVRASGITCIRTDEGFPYLSLVMDWGSRKTAGCHAGDTLEAEGALRALKMALENFEAGIWLWYFAPG